MAMHCPDPAATQAEQQAAMLDSQSRPAVESAAWLLQNLVSRLADAVPPQNAHCSVPIRHKTMLAILFQLSWQ